MECGGSTPLCPAPRGGGVYPARRRVLSVLPKGATRRVFRFLLPSLLCVVQVCLPQSGSLPVCFAFVEAVFTPSCLYGVRRLDAALLFVGT
jgi:hypothetical protein